MSEPAEDTPMVTRPAEVPLVAPVEATRMGFRARVRGNMLRCLEAVGWAALFVAVQLLAATGVVFVVFTLFALGAPDSQKFVDEQLERFGKAVNSEATGERLPVPNELGESLAWGMLAAQFASVGIIAVALPWRLGRDWKRQLGIRTPHWLHVVLVFLILPAFMIASDAVQTLFLSATGMKPPTAMKALNGIFGRFPWPLTTLAVAIGPGLVEELWCRGLIGRILSPRLGLVAAVVLTSLIFAAMHIDPTQLLVITLMGLYLHFVYLATRSIWVPIVLHASNNGLAILLALTLSQEAMDRPMPLVVPLVALSVLLFGSVALWTSRAEVQPLSAKKSDTHWNPEYPGISEPPPGLNLRLGYAEASPVAVIFTVVSFGVLMYLGYRYLI